MSPGFRPRRPMRPPPIPVYPYFFPRRQPRQQARRPPSYTARHVRERSCRQQAFGACAGGVAVSVAVGGKPAPGRSTPPSVQTILSSAAFPVLPPPRLRRYKTRGDNRAKIIPRRRPVRADGRCGGHRWALTAPQTRGDNRVKNPRRQPRQQTHCCVVSTDGAEKTAVGVCPK